MEGTGRWARYRVPRKVSVTAHAIVGSLTASAARVEVLPPLSESSERRTLETEIRRNVKRPLAARTPVGYARTFLDSYRPNDTFYLSQADRRNLQEDRQAEDRRTARRDLCRKQRLGVAHSEQAVTVINPIGVCCPDRPARPATDGAVDSGLIAQLVKLQRDDSRTRTDSRTGRIWDCLGEVSAKSINTLELGPASSTVLIEIRALVE